MRLPVALTIVLLAVIGLTGVLAVKSLRQPSSNPPQTVASGAANLPEITSAEGARPESSSSGAVPSAAVTATSEDARPQDPEDAKAAVEKRKDELMQLAANNDPQSLETILSELANRDPEIRQAALEATKSFGDRSAVPRLKQIAEATDDPSERQAILDTVHFLDLPSISEFARSNRSRPVAAKADAAPSVQKVSQSGQ